MRMASRRSANRTSILIAAIATAMMPTRIWAVRGKQALDDCDDERIVAEARQRGHRDEQERHRRWRPERIPSEPRKRRRRHRGDDGSKKKKAAVEKLPHIGCSKFLTTNHDPQDLEAVNYRGKNGEEDDADRESGRRDEVAGTVPCVGGSADGYPCNNVDLHSFIPLSEFAHPDESVNANDVWGWTHSPSGREFALIGLTSGTAFVEITDPVDPQYVGYLFSHGACSSWRDVKVRDDHAFVVSEAFWHGMQVFDLTLLLDVEEDAMPTQFQATAHYSGFGNAHNIVINEDSGYAYAVGTITFSGGLHMVNIQDPMNPVAAGGFSGDGYTHDAQCVIYNGPDSAYTGREICFCYNEDTLTIVDVTNKDNPAEVGRAGYSEARYIHQGWLTDDQRYVIVNDELDESNGNPKTKTHVFNVEDLANPTYVDYHSGTTRAIDHNLYVKGDLVFEANYRAGLQVLRIDDAASASFTEVANFDIYPSSDAASFNGAWSNYPYFPSGNVVVSGIEQGLFVLGSSNGWGAAGGGVGRRGLAAPVTDAGLEELRRRRLRDGCIVQDFESSSPGSTADWISSGSCSTGSFIVGTPSQIITTCVMTQPGGDHTTGSGQALYSAPNPDGNAGGDDVDDGECVSTSPVYQFSGPSIATVWFFHGQRDAGDDNGDYFALEAEVDGSGVWTSLKTIGDVSTRASWTRATATLLPAAELRLRVRASDGTGEGDVVEAGIDDVLICPADVAGGGSAALPTPNLTIPPTPAPSPPCPGQVEVEVNVRTDDYPGETSWALVGTCGGTDTVQESAARGFYQTSGVAHLGSYCVPPSEYRFEIADSYGDGICCDFGMGSYEVKHDGVVVKSGGKFASSEASKTFGKCGVAGGQGHGRRSKKR